MASSSSAAAAAAAPIAKPAYTTSLFWNVHFTTPNFLPLQQCISQFHLTSLGLRNLMEKVDAYVTALHEMVLHIRKKDVSVQLCGSCALARIALSEAMSPFRGSALDLTFEDGGKVLIVPLKPRSNANTTTVWKCVFDIVERSAQVKEAGFECVAIATTYSQSY